LTKPTRLYSKEELRAVHDVLASYSGEGVAKSLYYYRTREILSRSTLDWLKVIVNCLCLHLVFVLVYQIFRLSCISKSFSITSSYACLVSLFLFCLPCLSLNLPLYCLNLLTLGDAR
jgi:hypothetical protein